MSFKIKINNKLYIVKKSTRENKKYDVFDEDNNYLLSFGDKRYEQYEDKIGLYKHLNHYDKKRRINFRKRHGVFNTYNPNYPAFWSYNFLW